MKEVKWVVFQCVITELGLQAFLDIVYDDNKKHKHVSIYRPLFELFPNVIFSVFL